MRRHAGGIVVVVAASLTAATVQTWGPQGHRLVALVASNHLTPTARANVAWLLDNATLADVAVWADEHIEANSQSGPWHFVNVPSDAARYDRDRDCPQQPRVAAGSRSDRWRDCIVDRILYSQERLADSSRDRADRAIALKFLVHLIGDLHQPFHTIGVERGGNGIPVTVFGSTACAFDDGTRYACNLHAVWDGTLIAHRRLSDRQYVAELERLIARRGWGADAGGSPATWTMESHSIAKSALLPAQGAVDGEYYREQIGHVEERLARGGLRLAAALNTLLVEPAPHAGASVAQPAVAPSFRVDPSWPTIPGNWQFGQVASVSVDAQDHVWVLQRPGTLGPEEKPRAAPPVLEFDADGDFIQAWGGPGEGYEWPVSEHGIHVDHMGFVWIAGNGERDHQVLKFTKAGRFVLQIGRAGRSTGNADTENLNQPADMFVYPKTNELVVADGYGNRRVIVFDAANGRFKRMWGAFGNAPSDAPPNPAPPDADERGASQFVQPVHAARVSNDGLVYVSDRGGKRVQVFRLDGSYVTQVFIGRDCVAPQCGNGTTAASTAFSADPAQSFLYVGNRSQARVMIFDRSTLRLVGSFGQSGSAPGEFGTLHHMASDSQGNLYVTEVTPLKPENRRIQKFILVSNGQQ